MIYCLKNCLKRAWSRLRSVVERGSLRGDPLKLPSVAGFLLLLLALAACGGSGPRPGYTTQQQTVDGLTIGLERPQQPEVLKEYELFVTLANAEGRPIDGATVFLDMTMP